MLLIVKVKRTGRIDEAAMDLLEYSNWANRPRCVLGLAVARLSTKILRLDDENGCLIELVMNSVSDDFWQRYSDFLALYGVH